LRETTQRGERNLPREAAAVTIDMALLLFVRHGENDYVKKGKLAGRLPGVHLNEKGRQQAQAAAQTLRQMLPQGQAVTIYSSPLERTMETAEPVAAAFGAEVIPRPGLIETDYGEWQDKSVKQLSRLKPWKVVQHNPSVFRFPQGESFTESQHRIVQEIQGMAATHDPKDVIICVSHADPIKLAVAYFLGLPLDLFQRLGVSPGSITALNVGEGGSHLLTLNYQSSISFSKP
jgi:probable phosphomutase (TIGR03848 family)